ncbi:MAG: RIP metalloprotease RseP [Alphaproteobacteria bacterium]|nr:RIP metalloprotease RseP [Alphaproteobacteria bacterium]
MQHLLSLIQHFALPFILVITVVVFVHEFGHYWVARRCGIRIVTFSLNFGKALFGWTDKNGTKWQVGWLPLGGYVKMFGDADPSSASPDETVKTMTEEEKKVSFFHQSVNKRVAVVAAGPAANYIFAIIVMAVLFMFQGQPYSPPLVGALQENGVAARAGLLPGDKVISIDGETVSRFEDIKRIITLSTGSPVPFVIERNGAQQTFTIAPEMTEQTDHFGGKHKLGKIGIVSDRIDYIKRTPVVAVEQPAIETWNLSADTLKAIGQMVMGTRGSEEIGGPLRIAEMSGHIAQDGPWALVWFMAIISVNLGLVNLFPVPLLDGGHLLFYICEKLRGKPLHERVQEFGMRIGMALVVSLMLFATWNDLVHLEIISKLRALFS